MPQNRKTRARGVEGLRAFENSGFWEDSLILCRIIRIESLGLGFGWKVGPARLALGFVRSTVSAEQLP